MTHRLYHHHHLDSRRWDEITPRADDIVITTSYKAGTTWMQRIVGCLVFQSTELPGGLDACSPWVEFRPKLPREELRALAEGMRHRRFLKSHCAADAIPDRPDWKYIYVGRDPRDVFMSLVNHYGGHTPEAITMMNSGDFPGPGFESFDGDIRGLWRRWTTEGSFPWESDGAPYWSHLYHARSYWDRRDAPNLLMVHYSDLKADLEGGMRRIGAFLGIETPEENWPAFVDAASFATMKRDGDSFMPSAAMIWEGGAERFFHKGTNGRWQGVLTDGDLELYDAACARTLTPELRQWLENGSRRAV